MITKIEDYFTKGCGRCPRFDTEDCATIQWAEGLRDLRQICRDAGLTETLKWAHPCYMHGPRNIAIIGAFRGDFRLSFFEAGLLKDPNNILEKQGPNTRYPDMIRFTENAQVTRAAPTIIAYLQEAMRYAEAGLRAPKDTSAPDLPDELIEALDADPPLAKAFHNLTPGRQKSYVINLRSAKKPETRIARIEKFRDRILAGKGANEY